MAQDSIVHLLFNVLFIVLLLEHLRHNPIDILINGVPSHFDRIMQRFLCTGLLIFLALHLASSGDVPMVSAQPLYIPRHFAIFRHMENRSQSGGTTASWMWGWAWASDGTVSVVDRTPSITFPARPASFGTELVDPLLGYVIPLSSFTAPCNSTQHSGNVDISTKSWDPDPVLGCPDLCISGPHQPDQSEKWIALVQRGGCPFVEKARQAQKLGAKAVVVGGDRDNPDMLLNMYSERKSPASFCN